LSRKRWAITARRSLASQTDGPSAGECSNVTTEGAGWVFARVDRRACLRRRGHGAPGGFPRLHGTGVPPL